MTSLGSVAIVPEVPTRLTRRSITRVVGRGGLLAAAAAIAPPALQIVAQEGLSEAAAITLADSMVGRFNAADLEGLGKLFAPDVAVHLPWPIPGAGVDYLLGIYRLSKMVIPDSAILIDDLLIADDRIIALTTIRGTQSGSVAGVPVTGTELEFAAIFIARIADGKIAELWGQVDAIAAGLQLANAEDSVLSFLGAVLNPPSSAATPTSGGVPLEEIAALPGVSFVLEFAPDGSVIDYRTAIDIPQSEIDQAAKAGPTINTFLAVAAERYNDVSVLNWSPPKWSVFSGGERWSTVISGNRVVITETATTDFNALAAAFGVTG